MVVVVVVATQIMPERSKGGQMKGGRLDAGVCVRVCVYVFLSAAKRSQVTVFFYSFLKSRWT